MPFAGATLTGRTKSEMLSTLFGSASPSASITSGINSSVSRNPAAMLWYVVPTVLDADALHLLDDDLLEGVDTARLLVTPHEGELAALLRELALFGGVEGVLGLRHDEWTKGVPGQCSFH